MSCYCWRRYYLKLIPIVGVIVTISSLCSSQIIMERKGNVNQNITTMYEYNPNINKPQEKKSRTTIEHSSQSSKQRQRQRQRQQTQILRQRRYLQKQPQQKQQQKQQQQRQLQEVISCDGDDKYLFFIELLTDDFGYETTWEITTINDMTGNSEIVLFGPPAGQSFPDATVQTDSTCLEYGILYEFSIYDSATDGICCNFGQGYYYIYLESIGNDPYIGNPEFESSNTILIENASITVIEPSSESTSYDIGNTLTDGSFDECINNNDDDEYFRFLLVLTTDDFPAETYWEITEDNTGTIVDEFNIANEYLDTVGPSQRIEFRRCLPRKHSSTGLDLLYEFIMYDDAGDGICCSYGRGDYTLFLNDQEIYTSDGTFDFVEITPLVLDSDGGNNGNTGDNGNNGNNGDNGDNGNNGGNGGGGNGNGNIIVGPINSNHDDDLSSCLEHTFQLDLTTDDYPDETSWQISVLQYDPASVSSEKIIAEVVTTGDGSKSLVTLCLPFLPVGAVVDANGNAINLLYEFAIFDSFGDGICCNHGTGSYTVTFDGTEEFTGGIFERSERFVLDDTKCDTMFDYTVQINIETDLYGYETSWDIRDNNNALVAYGEGYQGIMRYEETYCLPRINENNEEILYKFTIYDTIGDGVCCGHGYGSYFVRLDGTVLGIGGEFNKQETWYFTEEFDEPDAFSDCTNGHRFQLNLRTDYYPRETSWQITDRQDNVVSSSALFDYTEQLQDFESRVCLPMDDLYIFTIYDEVGDGICCGLFGQGSYTVVFDDEIVATGGDFGSMESTFLTEPFDTELPVAGIECDGIHFVLNLITDGFPLETSWQIEDLSSNTVVASGQDYTEPLFEYKESHCLLSDGPFQLSINDSNGDGVCCVYGHGSYSVHVDGNLIASGSNFGRTAIVPFGDFSTLSQFQSLCNNGHVFSLELLTDSFPSETYWDIKDDTGALVSTGSNYENIDTIYEEYRCLPLERLYIFTMYDSFGDGICCTFISGRGEYRIYFDGVSVGSGGDFEEEERFFLSDEFVLPAPSPESCDEGFQLFVASFVADNSPWETTWDLAEINSDGVLVSGDYYSQTSYCLPSNAVYRFTVRDTGEDGMCCQFGQGSYNIAWNGYVYGAGGEFTTFESIIFGSFNNYDDLQSKCNDGGYAFALNLLTDNFPAETSWEITDSSGKVVSSGFGYEEKGTRYEEFRCLQESEESYLFTIYDSYDDGICCSEENGSGEYSITYNGNQWDFSGQFGASLPFELNVN